MIEYVKTLTPHAVKDSIAINKIADHSRKLQAILPKIVTLIGEETAKCERLEREMSECALDMQKLKNTLYKYTAIKREGYNVVCRNPKCPKREASY